MDVTQTTRNTVIVRLPVDANHDAHTVGREFFHSIRTDRIEAESRPRTVVANYEDDSVVFEFRFIEEKQARAYRRVLQETADSLRETLQSRVTKPKRQLRRSVDQMDIDGLPAAIPKVTDELSLPGPLPDHEILSNPTIRVKVEASLTSQLKLVMPHLKKLPINVNGLNAKIPYGLTHHGKMALNPLSEDKEIIVLEAIIESLKMLVKQLRQKTR